MESGSPRAQTYLKRELVLDLITWLIFGLSATVWCLSAARELGPTFDETTYITEGLISWRTGSHRTLMKLGTMPLPVDLQTLPLYVAERWRQAPLDPSTRMDQLLPWARAANLLFLWVLLAYGWLIARKIAGPWGGRVAVVFLALEPNILAHATLATTDLAITATLAASVFHFRAARESTWLRRIGIPAAGVAAAILSKASAIVFVPICFLAIELERIIAGRTPRAREQIRDIVMRLKPFWREMVQISALASLMALVLCGTDWRPLPGFIKWAHTLPEGKSKRTVVWTAEHLRIFSNAGEGVVRQVSHNVRSGGHRAFLLGSDRPSFWYYFPVALTIKLAPALLALILALLLCAPATMANWANIAALALLLCSPLFRVQIGIRFVLPLIALLVIGTSAAAVLCLQRMTSIRRRIPLAAALGMAVIGIAYSSGSVWPHGLCYTNAFWGGTERGYLRLSDSNYDWGQGLKELARWRQQHPVPAMDLWYFGTDPTVNTLPMRLLALHDLRINGPSDVLNQVRGHYLAASTTLLYGTSMTQAHRQAAAYLRSCRPVARTQTFLIYDFTRNFSEDSNSPAAK